MKLEIDIQNPEDQAAIAALAQTNGASVEDVTAGLVHHAIKEHQETVEVLRAHLAEGEAEAERGEFVTQSIDDMLTEFKAELNVG